MFLSFLVLFTVFLSLIVFVTSVNGSLNLWLEKIKIYAFISPETPDSKILKLIEDLKSNFKFKEVVYITQKDAWDRLKETLGGENEIFSWGSPEALPKALEITPITLEKFEDLKSFLLNYSFVEEIRYSENMINEWNQLNRVVGSIKKIFIYLGSLAFLIISVELLAHVHLAYPKFSVTSQIWENIFITFLSSFFSILIVYFSFSLLKDQISRVLPYFVYVFDLRHILVWVLYFVLSNIIISFTSALISFQRL
ncbi:MAG TPA: permease-like cell division protein FtsX [Dictyoglomaceae bacterium]|nr:permease-like cell division protein FtsX [Dictyoglomaceae bacterium]